MADVEDEPAATADGDDGGAAPPVGIDPDTSEIDAFEQGWFDDREAFPQIGLWASILILITALGYQIAKRTRHTSIGVLVSLLPFLVALYFFYQNVNRLLPPGL